MTDSLTETQRNAVVELLRVSPVADDLGRRFAAAGHRLHLVGGSVRDALLGRLGSDLDFATDARPEQVLVLIKDWAEAVWTTGVAFGTVGAQRQGFHCEITTYRADAYDRVSRKPEVTYGDSITDDLGRRDFTVNAMAVALPGHEFIDPYGGNADLAAGLLRTPRTPEESFADDPLRMMRAARFVSQIGFSVDDDVVTAMTAMAGELGRVSAERVRDELIKLLCGRDPRTGLHLLVRTGLADVVLPELPALRMEIDEHHQHKDVYTHTLTVLDQAIELEGPDGPDLVLRLAALMHDVGKPATRRKEPAGGVSFHHHEAVGAKMTRKRLTALRFPRELVDQVSKLVFLHLRFHGYGSGEWTDSAVRRYVTDAGPLLDRLHKLVRADSTTRNKRRAATLSRSYDSLEERIAGLRAKEELDAIRPDLDGTQIMALLGIAPGPLVGKAHKHLLALRMEHGPLGDERATAELLRWAEDNGVVSD
ncbi:MAG: CCA tRNA nucleotidyltransferase [Actinomycetota bacterium]|nr:CCA tRNA nucleotidyltransferase [Actinomycetota bacterium]